MQIIDFYSSKDKELWLSQLRQCDWRAGEYLCYLIDSGRFYDVLGKSSQLFLLCKGDKLLSFCALTERDRVETDLTPWVGFVYTYPFARGKRLMGTLFEKVKSVAAARGSDTLYLTTDHVGLYEKYGFDFMCMMKEQNGEDTRIYKINVNKE